MKIQVASDFHLEFLERRFPELVQPDSPTQRVGGAPASAFPPARHSVPMMSLENTYSREEVLEWLARVQKVLPGETLEWVVEPKVDGVAVSIRYEDGLLRLGATRGDGTTVAAELPLAQSANSG